MYAEVNVSQCEHLADEVVRGPGMAAWGVVDYLSALNELAAELDLPALDCAKRFGVVTVRPNDNGWRYHPVLGFGLKRA